MANYTTIALVGGPCDGLTKNVTATQLSAGQVTCKGALYVRTDAIRVGDLITFATSEAIAKANKGPSATHVTQAWSRWMRALGHTGPQSHRRIQRATARARRIAR